MSERSKLILLTALGGAAALFLFVVDPARSGVYPPCLFLTLTGLYCPGCGSARALHQLLHGHVAAAFGLNPAATLFLPVLAYAYLTSAVRMVRGQPGQTTLVSQAWIWLILVGVIAYWVARNVPTNAFRALVG